jgi:hypothetical protein
MVLIEGLGLSIGLIPLDSKTPSYFVGHDGSSAVSTTASPLARKGDVLPTAPSIEYVLGKQFGGDTAVRSLQLGIAAEAGITFYNSLSFNESGQRLPGIADARQAFKQLFGASPSAPSPGQDPAFKLRAEQSVVNAVKDSVKHLQSKLAGPERVKLDEHLAALADIEARLGKTSTVQCQTPTAPGETTFNGSTMPESTQTHFDLITQAFACDRTRFIVANWGILAGQLRWLFDSSVDDMHNAVAHVINDIDSNGKPTADAQKARLNMAKLNNWYAARIAALATKFASIQDGDGTLLDNTLIVWGTDFGTDVHGGLNVPYVLLGGAQKKLKMGRYLNYFRKDGGGSFNVNGYAPNNKLLVSIAQAFGITGDSFGLQKGIAPPSFVASGDFFGGLTGLS